jgi:FkbM family methyltransferase
LPGVTVVAFEPIPSEASTFHKVHGSIPYIKLIESALGETSGSAILHLSKSADSSSLLPIGSRQRELHHNTSEVGTIEVPIQRLDDLDVYWHPKKRFLLKLDVQGYELNVLKGAQEALKHCAYVYAECSEVPLYDGQALRPEVQSFLEARGFTLQGRYNEQWDKECLIQADYLFARG